jgi:hypothetical protein
MAPEKPREICGIFKSQIAGNPADGIRRINEPAPRFQCQPLLQQIKTGAAGQTAAQPVEAGLRKPQLPGKALDGPMLCVAILDHLTEAPQSRQIRTAMGFRDTLVFDRRSQGMQDAARQPAAHRGRSGFASPQFLGQTFQHLRRAIHERRVEAEIAHAGRREQLFYRRLMGRCGQFSQMLKVDGQYVTLRIGAKPKAVDRCRRYDYQRRALEIRAYFLNDDAGRPGGEQKALTQLGMPVRADLPEIFTAAGLNIFDVHGPRYAGRSAMLTVE